MQRFKSWNPVPQIPDYLSGASVVHSGANQASVICNGEFGNGKCLILKFSRIEEILIAEESARDWSAELAASRPGTVPLLMVEDSAWAKSSSQLATFGHTLHHFCIVSGDCCVDILAPDPPRVAWEERAVVNRLLALAEALGEA